MVTTIKRGASKKRITAILERISKTVKVKGIDAYKYCGKIKIKEDVLEIQKALRNEWE